MIHHTPNLNFLDGRKVLGCQDANHFLQHTQPALVTGIYLAGSIKHFDDWEFCDSKATECQR